MTTREAMTYLGISSSNFSRWQSTYGIPHVTVDGRRHFKREDLDRARKQRDDNLRRWCRRARVPACPAHEQSQMYPGISTSRLVARDRQRRSDRRRYKGALVRT
jgi:hypothetical protein